MIDEIFALIDKSALTSWGVVLLGLQGIPGCAASLSSKMVKKFAESKLINMDTSDDSFVDIYTLATEDMVSFEAKALIESFSVDMNLGLGKKIWRAFALMYTINITPTSDHSFDNILSLYEFWNAWEWPQDMPKCLRAGEFPIKQLKGNTAVNWKHILDEHKRWLINEIACIKHENSLNKYM